MSTGSRTTRPAGSRLRQLAQRSASGPEASAGPSGRQAAETCDLCGQAVEPEHRHLVDLESRSLMCACRPCTILFHTEAAGGEHYRLVPDRRRLIDDFELDEAAWQSLRVPVEMAFFLHDSRAGRTGAFYPSPMGATESQLELDAWTDLERANPVLDELQPDVEALLVNRARGASSHFIVPVDDCYELVGLIRTRWRGLTGGSEVWREIGDFFQRLAERSEPVTRTGDKLSRPPAASAAGGG